MAGQGHGDEGRATTSNGIRTCGLDERDELRSFVVADERENGAKARAFGDEIYERGRKCCHAVM